MKALSSRLRRRHVLAIPVMLALLFVLGIVASVGVAFAAAPASLSAGVAAPPAQQKGADQASPGKPSTNSGVTSPAEKRSPGIPSAPHVVLYDQYNNPASFDVTSQDFEAGFDQYDNQAADDFVVPAGQTWNVTEVDVDGEYSAGGGPAAGFNVYFYSNSTALPGTPVYTATNQTFTGTAGDAVITLTTPAVLAPGTYWVSVQSRQDVGTAGQWFWQNRSVVSNNPAAWRNPGNGFATGCTNWGVKTTCIPTQLGADQVFRLVGTVGGPTATSTATVSGATNTPTRTATVGGATATPTATVCVTGYSVITTTGTIISGTVDIGNHVDDGTTAITLPFGITFYGTTYTAANVSSNGNLQFTSNSNLLTNACPLPSTTLNNAIMPHWDDLRTDQVGTGCTAYPSGCGVFTSVSGSAPNRIFNIEWRTVYFGANTTRANFELRLYETTGQIDMVYGEVAQGGSSATVGVQRDTGSNFVQYECNTAGTLQSGLVVRFLPSGCGGTSTPTRTVTATSTACAGSTTWQAEPPMLTARRNPAVAVVGNNLYAISGFNAAPDYTTANERFNGTTWTTLAPIPTPAAQMRAASVGTNIYVPGGYNSISFGGPLSSMQIYSTTTDTWGLGAPLPAPRSGPAVVAYNGRVYIISGYTTPFPTGSNTVYEYNPATNTYATKAPMPAVNGNVPGALLNGEIYVVGGGVTPAAHYAYNPTTDTWRTIASPLTTTCQAGAAFAFGGEIWMVGCLGVVGAQQVQVYNPGSDSWRLGTLYTQDHQSPGADLFLGRPFVVGGGAAAGGSTAVESLVGGACITPTITPTRSD